MGLRQDSRVDLCWKLRWESGMQTSITDGCCSAEMQLELATWNVDIGSNVETIGDALDSALSNLLFWITVENLSPCTYSKRRGDPCRV